MIGLIKKMLSLALVLVMGTLLYAEVDSVYMKPAETTVKLNTLPNNELQKNPSTICLKREEQYMTFPEWLNENAYYIRGNEKDDKEKVREDWKNTLGIDIFSPYFVVRAMKEKVEGKSRLQFFKIRGKARIKEDEAKYIFSIKF